MQKYGTLSLLFILIIFAAITQTQQGEPEPIVTVRSLMFTGSEVRVDGSEAILTRMEHGISLELTTIWLDAGHVYTVWWVLFNLPENCSDNECGFNDVFLMDENGEYILGEDELVQLNYAGLEAVQIGFLSAVGTIANADGSGYFMAHLPINDETGFIGFGTGLHDSYHAEIHIIIRTHGPMIPEIVGEQLTTAWAGCPDPHDRRPCADLQFAIFPPPAN